MMGYALGAAALLPLVWVWLCAPARGRRANAWRGTAFAHRGLYGPDCPENSLAAFERACAAGCGIELDVQATKDGQLIVFHDDDARRMTGKAGLIRKMALSDVRALRLPGEKMIPTLEEVLGTVRGRVPLLVEIKSAPGIGAITKQAVALLRGYEDAYVVESFNPLCLYWLRRHAPDIVRGQLVQRYLDYRESQSALIALLASSLLLNALSRPDFIAHSRKMAKNPALWLNARVFRTPLAAWTISACDERDVLMRRGVMPIFEQID